MSSSDLLRHWVAQLRAGDQQGAQQLWETYFERLVSLARRKLRGRSRRVSDEEDVAISAFNSFCRGVEQGRFPKLADRDDLWKLLVAITLRKVLHLVRDSNRLKRGGKWVLLEDDLSGEQSAIIDRLVGREPTPAFAAQLAEQCEGMLARLESPELARLAVLKMEGFTNQEIAEKLGCAERTIERKLRLIRQRWEQDLQE